MSMPVLTIDPVGGDDRPLLVAMMADLQDHERQFDPDLVEGESMADAHIDWLLRGVETGGGTALLARMDGQPAGFVIALVECDEGFDLKPAHRRVGMITDLHVNIPHRRQGVATALLRRVELLFRDAGIIRLRVGHSAGNRHAAELYGKGGFGEYALIREKRLD